MRFRRAAALQSISSLELARKSIGKGNVHLTDFNPKQDFIMKRMSHNAAWFQIMAFRRVEACLAESKHAWNPEDELLTKSILYPDQVESDETWLMSPKDLDLANLSSTKASTPFHR